MTLGNMHRTALASLSIVLATVSHAQQPTLLNFACTGKMTDAMTGDKGQPIENLGLVVNLTAKTVSFGGYSAPFNTVDLANIYFTGKNRNTLGMDVTVDGNLDRVTGAVDVTVITTASEKVVTTSYWNMVCKPATRLF